MKHQVHGYWNVKLPTPASGKIENPRDAIQKSARRILEAETDVIIRNTDRPFCKSHIIKKTNKYINSYEV